MIKNTENAIHKLGWHNDVDDNPDVKMVMVVSVVSTV